MELLINVHRISFSQTNLLQDFFFLDEIVDYCCEVKALMYNDVIAGCSATAHCCVLHIQVVISIPAIL